MRAIVKSTAVAAGRAAALGLVPMAAPAACASDGDQLKARMSKACARVPHLVERTQRLQLRLSADAATRGSLAWLEAQSAQAASNGHADRAQMLDSRLTFRRELAGILPDRLTWLRQAQAICDKKAVNPSATAGSGS
jgi:hypothetical protein